MEGSEIMRFFITFLKNDLKLILKKPFALTGLFLLPVIFFLIIFYGFSGALYSNNFIEPFNVTILDEDNNPQVPFLTNLLKQTQIFKEVNLVTDPEYKETFTKTNTPALIILPQNFIQETSIGKNPPIQVIGNPNYPTQAKIVDSLTNSIANFITAGQSSINTSRIFSRKYGVPNSFLDSSFNNLIMQTFFQTLARLEIFQEKELENIYNIDTIFFIISAVLTLFIGFSSMPVIKIIATDKQNNINYRFKASNSSFIANLTSKFLITLTIVLVQLLILGFTLNLFIDINFTNNINVFYSVFLIITGVFAFSGFLALLTSLTPNSSNTDILANLLLFLMAIAGGCLYPINSLPDIVWDFGKYTIHGNLLNGLLMIFSNSLSNIHNVLISLFLWGFFCYSASFIRLNSRRVYT